jgi:hypothetical protein
MIGEDLLKAGSDVYYFRTSEQLDNAIDGQFLIARSVSTKNSSLVNLIPC